MTIKFPERQYLTFEELKVRWQCNDGDLRYLIVHGDLKPSVKLGRCTEENQKVKGNANMMQHWISWRIH